MEYLKDHSYLNSENINLLNIGDIIEYSFSTELNGIKNEKVKYLGRNNTSEGGVYDARQTKVEALKLEYIIPEFLKGDIFNHCLRALETENGRKKEWDNYCIYTNGWNPLKIKTVNGKLWTSILDENNLNRKSAQEQEIEINQKEVNELINISKPFEIKSPSYKHYYQLIHLPIKEYKEIEVAYVSVCSTIDNVLLTKSIIVTDKDFSIKKEKYQKPIKGYQIWVPKGEHSGDMYYFILPNQDIEKMQKELENIVLSAGDLITDGFCKGGILLK